MARFILMIGCAVHLHSAFVAIHRHIQKNTIGPIRSRFSRYFVSPGEKACLRERFEPADVGLMFHSKITCPNRARFVSSCICSRNNLQFDRAT